MPNLYGPWATSMDAGWSPQLSTFWRRRLTMLVSASQTSAALSRRNLFWLVAAALLALLPPTLYAAPAAVKGKPGVLIYQIEPKSEAMPLSAADTERVLKVVEQRLNGGKEKLAKVKRLDDARIEVDLVTRTAAASERVKQLLARPGTLEFRIVADIRIDKAIIDRARKDETKDVVLDDAGKKVACWVPVKNFKELAGQAEFPHFAVRTKKKDYAEVKEVLVLADADDVTGDYLKQVKAAVDSNEMPCVNFTFNKKGGELFGKLTGANLPDRSSGVIRRLAIILDGQLFAAPSVMSRIQDRGQITGRFSEQEVSDLAKTLNAGSMPGRLQLIEKLDSPRRTLP